MQNIHLIRDVLLFTLGVLLLVYSTLNIAISPAPTNIADIPNQYGKTFCIPIESIEPSSDQSQSIIRKKINNAYILVILSLVGGIFLVLVSFFGVWKGLTSLEIKAAKGAKQVSRQLQKL